MKLLIDTNLSPPWTPLLGAVGIEATHWRQVGRGDAPGEVLFQWARSEGAVIIDFCSMPALTRAEAPSVFPIRTDDVAPDAVGPRAIVLRNRFSAKLETGALIVADERRERVRFLPLGDV